MQRAVDEKFHCVEEKEEETRRLRLLLREKERDLERQRCVLDNNEETITVSAHRHTHSQKHKHKNTTLISWVNLLRVSVSVCQSLELLLRGKAVQLQQVVDAWQNVQRQRQESEEMQSWSLRERDAIIGQLQAALLARTQEAQVHRGATT